MRSISLLLKKAGREGLIYTSHVFLGGGGGEAPKGKTTFIGGGKDSEKFPLFFLSLVKKKGAIISTSE